MEIQYSPNGNSGTELTSVELELAIEMYSEFFELYIEELIDNAPRVINIARPI